MVSRQEESEGPRRSCEEKKKNRQALQERSNTMKEDGSDEKKSD